MPSEPTGDAKPATGMGGDAAVDLTRWRCQCGEYADIVKLFGVGNRCRRCGAVKQVVTDYIAAPPPKEGQE